MDSQPQPHRIDHVWLSDPVPWRNWLRYLFLRRRSRGLWLVLMKTGEVRIYGIHKRKPNLEGRAPLVSVASASRLDVRVARKSLLIRVGDDWRRIRFSGHEKALPRFVLLPILGDLGEILQWLREGFERARTHNRRRDAFQAWKALFAGTATVADVPGNVEPGEAKPPAAAGVPTPG
jgi:hypothetical protein